MRIFNCNYNEWPICLFDFTYKNKIPNFLCFRASNDSPIIIEDYFDFRKEKNENEEVDEFYLP